MMRTAEEKIMSLEQAALWAKELRKSGKTLAVTNGVFDLLHRGHAEYLARAAQEADCLLVALNGDASVRALKGPERPIVSEDDRAWLLASLECVAAVVIFPSTRATEVFRAIAPDVYVKGGDYTEESLDPEEHGVLKSAGARFCFIPLIAGRSTTSTVKQIRGEAKADHTGNSPILPLLSRRSVRKFQLRPVGREMLEELLRAAMAAPSACRKDPWRFHVVMEREKLDSLAECLPNGQFLREASAAILVTGVQSEAHGGELSYMLQDCAAAQENLLLAASMMGLGACWLGVHPRQERMAAICKKYHLPEGEIPVAASAIGWPADFPKAQSRYDAKKVFWE